MNQQAGVEQEADRMTLVDRLLRRPGELFGQVNASPRGVGAAVVLLGATCFLVYGLVVGSFSGGPQFYWVPLKLLAISALAALICLPSLHILACLDGGQQTLGQSAAALLLALSLTGLLLLGFAPVAWIFSQSTSTVAFMGFLHLAFVVAALRFGYRLLSGAIASVNGSRPVRVLAFWAIIFLLVCFQMCTAVRPLVGPFQGTALAPKQFFAMHWLETISGVRHRP